MINTYFGFTKNPFSKAISEKDIFIFKDFENIKNRLQFFLKEGGFFLLTGMIGSGKTTALKMFASSLNPNTHRMIYINDTFTNKRDFYRTISRCLDLNAYHYIDDARYFLKKYILELFFVKKIMPIFVFDEAQNLSGFILEEIRLLSNHDYDSINPVSFIISGHNLLKQRINIHENEALNQRITMRFNISGMTLAETCSFINNKLSLAGSSSAIFTDSVLNKIYEASSGIPRMINKICYSLLLSAMANNKKIIDDLLFSQTSGEWD